MMEKLDLQLLTPQELETFIGPTGSSTIDLTFASESLMEDFIKCKPLETQHGSDHQTIETHFDITAPVHMEKPRLLYKSAPWDKIRKKIKSRLTNLTMEKGDVNAFTAELLKIVSGAVQELVPVSQPSPYAKRWWSKDLTQLWKTYTYWRNQATNAKRQSAKTSGKLARKAAAAKRNFFKAVRVQKKQHWSEFLDDVQNIWQAARFLDPSKTSAFAKIPYLECEDGQGIFTAETDKNIAKTLIKTFFPSSNPTPPIEPSRYTQLPWTPITEEEIETVLNNISQLKAPRIDELPTKVWKELWPVIKETLLVLFQTSLTTGTVPEQWKVAKILLLKKEQNGKRNYSKPNSWRPISLLSTLGKIMESILAERISYLVETHTLLPSNHFSGRKKRSTEQALIILIERIHDAWRSKKVLTATLFDIKGAFNGVDNTSLLHSLRKRQIPEVIVRWIESFLSNRKAQILVNSFTSETAELHRAGLPQGSPLSPILFFILQCGPGTAKN